MKGLCGLGPSCLDPFRAMLDAWIGLSARFAPSISPCKRGATGKTRERSDVCQIMRRDDIRLIQSLRLIGRFEQGTNDVSSRSGRLCPG